MTHEVDKHVGKQIRARRHVLGLTQTELAEAIGVKFQQVQKYETGANRVSASKLFLMAETLQVEIAYFWEGIDSRFAVSGTIDSKRAMDRDEIDMLSAFRRCPKGAKKDLISIAAATGGAA
ncbi:helix-turn-helix domain-containing protein [Roseovarius sp. MMSF_3281]|uniref:helix-turn-helix domain-containing protein n=1 Tax=Roseovarius sp. MMSF_3281 TaxID=3046694 RepID=UPI00273EE24F|nr:helix-turn-helix transcriptional regulator [Roseovarius sp. MMSF_3281]